jgi:hypothetical protein
MTVKEKSVLCRRQTLIPLEASALVVLQFAVRVWDKRQLKRPRQMTQNMTRTRLKMRERRMGMGR